MKKTIIFSLIIIALSFIIAITLFPLMPEEMASHWNASGNVDGYMSKLWGLFLIPIISLGMVLLFIYLPKIDPKKINYKKFEKYYDTFVFVMVFYLFYVYCISLLWNLDIKLDMNIMMIPVMAVLFYYIGVLIEKAEPNWFVGIRTPWTLSSPTVWKKTHKIGGKLFKICGGMILLGLVFKDEGYIFMIGPILLTAGYLIIYSYLEYKKEKKKN